MILRELDTRFKGAARSQATEPDTLGVAWSTSRRMSAPSFCRSWTTWPCSSGSAAFPRCRMRASGQRRGHTCNETSSGRSTPASRWPWASGSSSATCPEKRSSPASPTSSRPSGRPSSAAATGCSGHRLRARAGQARPRVRHQPRIRHGRARWRQARQGTRAARNQRAHRRYRRARRLALMGRQHRRPRQPAHAEDHRHGGREYRRLARRVQGCRQVPEQLNRPGEEGAGGGSDAAL